MSEEGGRKEEEERRGEEAEEEREVPQQKQKPHNTIWGTKSLLNLIKFEDAFLPHKRINGEYVY